MYALPLQVIDNFLLNYNLGDVLVLVLVLGLLGTLPLRSKSVTGLFLGTFGFLFLITPLSLMGNEWVLHFLGVGLIFVGPMIVIMDR
ncbi:hypothetical protein [Halocatena halophila]|uniref:hypothetical protein n=1 Tax=Halocatena halophila TaxID=2814576 RepID=UPI002ED4DE2F